MSIFLSTAKKILIHSENIMNINIHSHYESKVNINTIHRLKKSYYRVERRKIKANFHSGEPKEIQKVYDLKIYPFIGHGTKCSCDVQNVHKFAVVCYRLGDRATTGCGPNESNTAITPTTTFYARNPTTTRLPISDFNSFEWTKNIWIIIICILYSRRTWPTKTLINSLKCFFIMSICLITIVSDFKKFN